MGRYLMQQLLVGPTQRWRHVATDKTLARECPLNDPHTHRRAVDGDEIILPVGPFHDFLVEHQAQASG